MEFKKDKKLVSDKGIRFFTLIMDMILLLFVLSIIFGIIDAIVGLEQ